VEPASGAAIRRVEAEVGVVFGAQLATGLLVGVEPVEQALRIGRADLQAQQQPAGGGRGAEAPEEPAERPRGKDDKVVDAEFKVEDDK